jgi:hypothetical protein
VATLVAVEAVAIVLLGLLVAGLLRSHAEILRSLHRLGAGVGDAPDGVPAANLAAPALAAPAQAASDLAGTSPVGEVVRLGVVGTRHDTLLAFLSSGCHTCAGFWEALGSGSHLAVPPGTRVVIVTKGPDEESRSRIAELAPGDVPLVMSTAAWRSYGVPVTPYFAYVDGRSGRVVGQGSGNTWAHVMSMLRQARGDEHLARPSA